MNPTKNPFTPDSSAVKHVWASPNHNERKNQRRPEIVLLHYTGMDDDEKALHRLSDPAAEVSCHYFIQEDGRIYQMVPETRRAWHAGAGSWAGEGDINSRSIGIEIANRGHNYPERDAEPPPFPDAQIDAVIRLVADIANRWHILPWNILAHSDIAPGRKRDPGERFPWRRLHESGLGHWSEPAPIAADKSFPPNKSFSLGEASPPIAAIQAMLATYGYAITVSGEYNEETKAVVEAFQRHFRPERVDGIADVSTVATLHALLAAMPPR